MFYSKPNKIRYERKFLCEGHNNLQIESIIKRNPALFSKIYTGRYINNIYLDTHNFKFYLDNAFGNRNRLKVRIRWYGELFGKISNPTLEFKIKKGAVGDKYSFPLTNFYFDKKFNINTLNSILKKSNLPDDIYQEVRLLEPKLLNRYDRKYYLSNNKLFRVTIDRELTYININSWNNSFNNKQIDRHINVVEMKYATENNQYADNITKHFPFRLSKNSKYVNGIEKFNFNIPI